MFVGELVSSASLQHLLPTILYHASASSSTSVSLPLPSPQWLSNLDKDRFWISSLSLIRPVEARQDNQAALRHQGVSSVLRVFLCLTLYSLRCVPLSLIYYLGQRAIQCADSKAHSAAHSLPVHLTQLDAHASHLKTPTRPLQAPTTLLTEAQPNTQHPQCSVLAGAPIPSARPSVIDSCLFCVVVW